MTFTCLYGLYDPQTSGIIAPLRDLSIKEGEKITIKSRALKTRQSDSDDNDGQPQKPTSATKSLSLLPVGGKLAPPPTLTALRVPPPPSSTAIPTTPAATGAAAIFSPRLTAVSDVVLQGFVETNTAQTTTEDDWGDFEG